MILSSLITLLFLTGTVSAQDSCSDGTLFGECSANIPEYCDEGILIDRCQVCGCAEDLDCLADGICDEYRGDVIDDGIVDIQDLSAVGSNLGRTGQDIQIPGADITGEGSVDIYDLVAVGRNFGKERYALPETPQATYPVEGETVDIPYKFDWDDTQPGSEDIDGYVFQIDDDPLFLSPEIEAERTVSQYWLVWLANNITFRNYYFRIKARDTYGNFGNWSDSVPFMALRPFAKGVFNFVPILRFFDQSVAQENILDYPYVDGITLIIPWYQTEPEDDQHDWSQLDDVVGRVAQRGKKVNLQVRPGSATPEWVYGEGDDDGCGQGDGDGAVKFMYRQKTDLVGDVDRIEYAPLPWDDYYLDKWEEFLSNLSERYGNNQTINYIAIAGPNLKHATATELRPSDEVIEPCTESEIQRLMDAGYTYEIYANAWKRMIDSTARIFPQKHLSFSTSDLLPGERSSDLAFELVGYGLTRYGNRFHIMPQFLNGVWFQTLVENCEINKSNGQKCFSLAEVIDLVKDSSDETETGWQMLHVVNRLPEGENETIRQAIDNALIANGSWIEFFSQDLRYGRYEEDYIYAHEELK